MMNLIVPGISVNNASFFPKWMALMASVLFSFSSPAQTITTIAGTGIAGFNNGGAPAAGSYLYRPEAVAFDASGNLYVADRYNHRVRKISTAGIITTIAGNGTAGYGGDGGPATNAQLNHPLGVAADASGNVFIADHYNHRIRKVNAAGVITTITGNGMAGYGGDGGPAAGAQVNYPSGIATDLSGNVYISDGYNHRIRKINLSGNITTIAGTGMAGYGGDGGPAAGAFINYPAGLTLDPSGNIFFSDFNNHRIRRITADGNIATVAGTGEAGFSGDGGAAASARLYYPSGIDIDASGNLLFCDYFNQRIRKIGPGGTISTIAGTGTAGYIEGGGLATSTQTNYPTGVAVDASGNVFFADRNSHRIRKVTAEGMISTVAGMGVPGYNDPGGPATGAQLNNPQDMAVDSSGNLYVADRLNHRVRKVNKDGVITTLAGTGAQGFGGDGGQAAGAQLNSPEAVAVDPAGNLYIADRGNHRVRKVNREGIITTITGMGVAGFSGDGGAAAYALCNSPAGVAVDASGNIYISDGQNHRLRKINAAGIISTIAGTGLAGYNGDGQPGIGTQLSFPAGISIGPSGTIYFSDRGNQRIRKISASGIVSTVAGTGEAGYSGDGGPATGARLNNPAGIATDAHGNVYFADYNNHRARKINTSGVITTVAGTGAANFSGEGGAAASAALNFPAGIAADPSGSIYIADQNNQRIRKVTGCVATSSPGAITGDALACPGNTKTYVIASTASGPGYDWTAPAGAYIVSGQGTNAVTLAFVSTFKSGVLSVKVPSECPGTDNTAQYNVYTEPVPATPAAIAGANKACRGEVKAYSIPIMPNAAAYQWTVPAGASIISGQGTARVEVEFGPAYTGGTLGVRATSCGGTSTARTLSVAAQPKLAAPAVITGAATPACFSVQPYSVGPVTGALSYNWTAPANTMIVSGQGTARILLAIKPGYAGGTLSVSAVNCGGNGAARALTLGGGCP